MFVKVGGGPARQPVMQPVCVPSPVPTVVMHSQASAASAVVHVLTEVAGHPSQPRACLTQRYRVEGIAGGTPRHGYSPVQAAILCEQHPVAWQWREGGGTRGGARALAGGSVMCGRRTAGRQAGPASSTAPSRLPPCRHPAFSGGQEKEGFWLHILVCVSVFDSPCEACWGGWVGDCSASPGMRSRPTGGLRAHTQHAHFQPHRQWWCTAWHRGAWS